MKKTFLFIALAVLAASCASQKYSRTDNITDDVYFSPSEIDYSVKTVEEKTTDSSDGFTYDESPSTANPNASSSYHQYQQQQNSATNQQSSSPQTSQVNPSNASSSVFQNIIIMPSFGGAAYSPYYNNINPWFGSYSHWGYCRPHRTQFNLIWIPQYGWTVNYNLGYNPYYCNPYAYNPYYANNPYYGGYSPYYGNYSPYYDPYNYYGYNYNPYHYNGFNNNYYNGGNSSWGSSKNNSINTNNPRRSGGSYVPSNLGTYVPGKRRAPVNVNTSPKPGTQSENGQDIGTPSASPQRNGGGITPSQGNTDRKVRPSRGSNSSNDDNQPSARPSRQPSPTPSTPSTRPSEPSTRPAEPAKRPSYNPPSRPSGGSGGGGTRSRGGNSGGNSGGGSSPRRR